jgi:hypothetical protein
MARLEEAGLNARRMLPEAGPRKRVFSILAAAAVVVAAGAFLVIRSRSRTTAPPLPASSASATIPPSAGARLGPKGRVSVGVFDEGQPLPDRTVVFQDSEGNVVGVARSDRDGKAAGELGADGMVTVALGTSLQHMVTIAGVQPGDELVVGEPVDEESVASVAGSSKVRLPGPYPGAARYTVSLGVGATETIDPATPVPLPVFNRFLVGGKKFKALAEALDAESEPLAFAFTWGAWDDSKTKAHGEADVRLRPWSTQWRVFELALTNAPADITSVEAKLTIFSKDEDRFERKPRRTELHGAATLRFPVPPPLGTEARYTLDLAYGASTDKAALVVREEAMRTKSTVDLGARLLPRVSEARSESTDVRARPLVRWRVAGDASAADASIVRVAWPATREHVWTVVLPPTAPTRFRLPSLPSELDAWAPDLRPMTAAAALVEASFYADFAEVKRKGLQLLAEPPEDAEGGVKLRYSATGGLEP